MFRIKKDRIEYENKSLRLPVDLSKKFNNWLMKMICLLIRW